MQVAAVGNNDILESDITITASPVQQYKKCAGADSYFYISNQKNTSDLTNWQ